MRRLHIVITALLIIVIGAVVLGWRAYSARYALRYEEQILDRSVLTHDPCAPPCWYGIVPGATMSLEQVEEIVKKVPSVASFRIYDGAVEWGWSEWPGSTRKKWRSEINSVSVKDGKITRILLSPDFPLSVAEILELYGEPVATWSSQVGVPEHPYVALRLFYPAQGLTFVAAVMPWLEPVLEPGTEVYELAYREPAVSLDAWKQTLNQDVLLAPMPGYGRMDEEFILRPKGRFQPDTQWEPRISSRLPEECRRWRLPRLHM